MPSLYNKPNTQDHILFLVMRRMRAPLIVMISITAISVLGMVLIPGMDEQGHPYHMRFFEAFYFVSFMTTTIGFGEIPHAFTPEQRFWVTLCIYPTVVGWLYAFGSIVSLMQDNVFKETVFHNAFSRHVRHLREPFFLICGYGATGHLLVNRLTSEYRQCVVVDVDQQSINELTVEDLHLYVPGLSADASESEHLIKAGLKHPLCRAVAAITNDDRVNLKIAMTARLLHPDIPVVARTNFSDTSINMHAFGVHHIINPFEIFAEDIAEAMMHPNHYRFRALLLEDYEDTATERLSSMTDKHWVLCGFGRLGQKLYHRLTGEGVSFVVVDAFPDRNPLPESAIIGRGIDETALMKAGIGDAAVIIAATDDDMDNLSIIMAARQLNPQIFSIARQVARTNDELFDTANIDMRMQCNYLVARKSHTWLSTPLLHDFSDQIAQMSEKSVNRLMQRIFSKVSADKFQTWQVRLDNRDAPGIAELFRQGMELKMAHLLKDPWHPEESLPHIALLVEHNGREWILPGPSLPLKEGMNILFCGCRTTIWRAALLQKEALEFMLEDKAERLEIT